jgi:hypothetical protein
MKKHISITIRNMKISEAQIKPNIITQTVRIKIIKLNAIPMIGKTYRGPNKFFFLLCPHIKVSFLRRVISDLFIFDKILVFLSK